MAFLTGVVLVVKVRLFIGNHKALDYQWKKTNMNRLTSHRLQDLPGLSVHRVMSRLSAITNTCVRIVGAILEPIPGIDSAVIIRRGRSKVMKFDSSPLSGPSIDQRRCLGSYSDAKGYGAYGVGNSGGFAKCEVCEGYVPTVIHYTTQGKREGWVIDEHYIYASRQCAECNGGIWDDHYLCEDCRSE